MAVFASIGDWRHRLAVSDADEVGTCLENESDVLCAPIHSSVVKAVALFVVLISEVCSCRDQKLKGLWTLAGTCIMDGALQICIDSLELWSSLHESFQELRVRVDASTVKRCYVAVCVGLFSHRNS